MILLDLMMPGIDGLEVLRQIKAAGVSSEVVIITGHVDRGLGGRGHEAGRRRLPQQALLARSAEDGPGTRSGSIGADS